MSTGPGFTTVEQPFIDLLVSMGWKWTTGNLDFSNAWGRTSFRDVLLHDDMKQALRRINRDDEGKEWLDDGRIAPQKRMEAPEAPTIPLLPGTHIDKLPRRGLP